MADIEDTGPRWWNGCEQSKAATVVIYCFYALVVTVGIVGNTISIVLLGSRRGKAIMSEAFRVYIIALALSDNGLLIFTGLLRYTLLPYFYDANLSSWYDLYACKWHRFFMHFFHNAAVWLLVVTTVDRFIAVCCPLTYRSFNHNSRHAKQVTFATLVLSALFASPFLLVGPIYDDHIEPKVPLGYKRLISNLTLNNYTEETAKSSILFSSTETLIHRKVIGCSMESLLPENAAFAMNVALHATVGILLPYFVLIGLNLTILYRIHFSRRLVNSLAAKKQRLGRKITIMMVTVCLVFVALWMPQVIMLFLHTDAHTNACGFNVYFSSVATICLLSSSALNFFLYCMTMKKFRRAAWSMITCSTLDRYGRESSRHKAVAESMKMFWSRRSESNQSSSNGHHAYTHEEQKLCSNGVSLKIDNNNTVIVHKVSNGI